MVDEIFTGEFVLLVNFYWRILFITLGKTSSQNTKTVNLKFLLQLEMILLIYLMVPSQYLTFRIILNLFIIKKTRNFD